MFACDTPRAVKILYVLEMLTAFPYAFKLTSDPLRSMFARFSTRLAPPEWVLGFITGGYRNFGTEITLDNTDLQEAGLVRTDCECYVQ